MAATCRKIDSLLRRRRVSRWPPQCGPESGFCRPAMQSSTVVLPGARRAKQNREPGGDRESDIELKWGFARCRTPKPASAPATLSSRAATAFQCRSLPSPHSPAARCGAIRKAAVSKREAQDQQQERRTIGGSVVQRLDLVVNQYRNRLRCARNVAANHQHHPKFAQRVREAQDKPRQHARRNQGATRFSRTCASAKRPAWPTHPAACGPRTRKQPRWAAPRTAGCRAPSPVPVPER